MATQSIKVFQDLRRQMQAHMGLPARTVSYSLWGFVKANEKVLRALLKWPYLHPVWVPILIRAFVDGELRVDPDGDVWIERELITSSELTDKAPERK